MFLGILIREFSDIGENSETRKHPKSGVLEGIFLILSHKVESVWQWEIKHFKAMVQVSKVLLHLHVTYDDNNFVSVHACALSL